LNKNLYRIAAIIFFLVFFVEVIRISIPFTMVVQNLQSVSTLLFTTYLVPFELLSLILVGGIIGMFYIAGRES